MSNTVNDIVIRIKNGYTARRESIDIPYSKIIGSVIELLIKEKYIKKYQLVSKKNKKNLVIKLLYNEGKPAVMDVKNISKPGRRIYYGVKDIKPVLGDFGCAVFTTSKGIMTGKDASKQKIGGELLFKIW